MAQSSAKSADEYAQNRRVHLGAQVLLLNPRFGSDSRPRDTSRLFDSDAWDHCEPVSTGRGANWFVDSGGDQYVLRHFQRGGAVARLLGDKYWFTSEDATRSFAEYRLLRKLSESGLPVPEPVAAGYRKNGLWYTAQLLTKRIPDAQTWSHVLYKAPESHHLWSRVGATVASLHKVRIDHADLNAHNILVNNADKIFVIDFDKSTERPSMGGRWREANLARLKRSLYKILPDNRPLVDQGWSQLVKAYEQGLEG